MKNKYMYLLFAATISLTACHEDDQFKGELYKKVIYVLSDDNLLMSEEHDLNMEESVGHVSIGCGGTEHIQHDVTVELEYDEEAVPEYNRLNFDIDESKFAHELDPARYRIPSMSVTLKAESEDNYATLPIYIKAEGLSPDSTYLIPLRIKSVSDYEVNPDKTSVMYRVYLKNDYATQASTTIYRTRGTESYYNASEDRDVYGTFTLSRYVVPLTKNSIRCFAGMNTYDPANLTKEEIEKCAMQVIVNEDYTLSYQPIGTIQIEMLGGADANSYGEVVTSLNKTQTFYLNYRYRLLKDGCDGSNGDADYEEWHTIEEVMTRTESLMGI